METESGTVEWRRTYTICSCGRQASLLGTSAYRGGSTVATTRKTCLSNAIGREISGSQMSPGREAYMDHHRSAQAHIQRHGKPTSCRSWRLSYSFLHLQRSRKRRRQRLKHSYQPFVMILPSKLTANIIEAFDLGLQQAFFRLYLTVGVEHGRTPRQIDVLRGRRC